MSIEIEFSHVKKNDPEKKINLEKQTPALSTSKVEISKNTVGESQQTQNTEIKQENTIERIRTLKNLSYKPLGIIEMEKEPAYKRKNIKLDFVPHSSDSQVSRYTLSETGDEENKTEIKPNNPFLHDNVD